MTFCLLLHAATARDVLAKGRPLLLEYRDFGRNEWLKKPPICSTNPSEIARLGHLRAKLLGSRANEVCMQQMPQILRRQLGTAMPRYDDIPQLVPVGLFMF